MEENKIIIKPKMRITLLDSELRCISDRLVDQATEFMQGAKVKHTDPIKLEVVLTSKNDIESLKTSLAQTQKTIINNYKNNRMYKGE